MSLTRDEWCKMWDSIKKIEYEAKQLRGIGKTLILTQVKYIKDQIQSVVGQME